MCINFVLDYHTNFVYIFSLILTFSQVGLAAHVSSLISEVPRPTSYVLRLRSHVSETSNVDDYTFLPSN